MVSDVTDVDRTGHGEARGYSWPPFEPGNTLGRKFLSGHEVSLKHGSYSPRRVDPLAAELIEQVTAEAGASGSDTQYLATVSYRPALVAWARCEARVQLLHEYLGQLTDYDPDTGRPGDVDGSGDVRPAAELLLRLEGQALKHRERLGLDPLARARLGRDVAAGSVDMAKLMSALADGDASDEITTTATDDEAVDGADDDGS